MSISGVLSTWIRSLARREVKPLITDARKRTAEHRRSIAALKRELVAVRRELSTVKKAVPAKPKITAENAEGKRLRTDGMKAHRKRLGLSAGDYAKLVGVSSLTIYNWENKKSKPRRSQLAGILSVRGIGKREAMKRLSEANG